MSSNQAIYNFATIGEVFDDGVTLIFDGQDAATEKHYKVNTSIVFQPGDRVKILADSGTYVVEYVVGTPKADSSGSGLLPAGGEKGKSLIKSSDDDYAIEWGTPDGTIPTGGAAGQVLKKTSATDYAAEWGTPDGTIPTGGAAGQVLKKTSSSNYAVQWGSVDGTIPAGGTAGQGLVKDSTTNYDVSWGNPVAASVVNQYRPTYATFNIQFQTDASGNFYIRYGTTGTWKKITVG